ncbi:M16 family metallopeptidase [Streptomyces sp. SPB074]|uniref:M16 family metallopeptidase n=1 Tax=Streptomyces sp. (strain SPB074) TaxID=465543 RepID=UPI0001D1DC6B|nr:pitrilysin family protein [Streptomyces sp. SPB074]EFG65809.1 proteinase [Streptomyces sp. SPB074]
MTAPVSASSLHPAAVGRRAARPRPQRPVPVPVKPWLFPALREEVLANGVTLLTCDRPGQEVLSVEIVVAAPLVLEPRDVEGVLGITTSALVEGVPGLSSLDFIRELENYGATLGVGAEHAGLRITLDVPGTHLVHALALLVRAMREPLLSATAVDRLVRARIHALVRHEAEPERRAALELHAAVFDSADRRSRPARGTQETVRNIDRDAVVACHRSFLRPAVTTVVVAGDLSGNGVEAALHRVLSSWEGESGTLQAPPSPPARDKPAVIVVDRPGAVQTRLVLGRAATARTAPGWDALLIGNHSLGGSVNARLDRELREAKGYTYGFHSRLLAVVQHSLAVVTGAVETSVTGDALGDVRRILQDVAERGIDERERSAAVAQIVDAAPLRYLTAATVADEIAVLVLDGRAPATLPGAFRRAAAVTVEEASAALREAFAPDRLVTVAVGDASRIAEAIAEVTSSPVHRV